MSRQQSASSASASASTDEQIRDEEQQMREDEEQDEEEQYEEQDENQDGDQQQQPPRVDNSEVYKIFDRSTAAGRAMYKLYNKNKTSYTPAVSITTRPSDPHADAEAKKKRDAAALIKPKYRQPKLKRVEPEREVGRVPLWGGKKTTHTIDRENERDAHLYKAPSVPLAKLQQRDVEKQKLQEAHQKKSANVPNAPLPGREKMSIQSAPRDPNQILYDKIVEEIDERHQFLDSMRALGDLKHESAVKAEISQRLRDLKQLEKIMNEDVAGQGTAVASSSSTSSVGRRVVR